MNEKDIDVNIHWIAPKDERVAEVCKSTSGKIFPMTATEIFIRRDVYKHAQDGFREHIQGRYDYFNIKIKFLEQLIEKIKKQYMKAMNKGI